MCRSLRSQPCTADRISPPPTRAPSPPPQHAAPLGAQHQLPLPQHAAPLGALTLMMISMPSLLVDSGAAISSAVRNWLDTLPLRKTCGVKGGGERPLALPAGSDKAQCGKPLPHILPPPPFGGIGAQ